LAEVITPVRLIFSKVVSADAVAMPSSNALSVAQPKINNRGVVIERMTFLS
jgi:hypothetical protein